MEHRRSGNMTIFNLSVSDTTQSAKNAKSHFWAQHGNQGLKNEDDSDEEDFSWSGTSHLLPDFVYIDLNGAFRYIKILTGNQKVIKEDL